MNIFTAIASIVTSFTAREMAQAVLEAPVMEVIEDSPVIVTEEMMVACAHNIVNTLTSAAIDNTFAYDFFVTCQYNNLRVEVALVEGRGFVFGIGDGIEFEYIETQDYYHAARVISFYLWNY